MTRRVYLVEKIDMSEGYESVSKGDSMQLFAKET